MRATATLAVGVLAAAAALVASYVASPAHQRHDPVHALQQIDLLYLDQPAPQASRLGLRDGTPTLLVVCDGCRPPPVSGAQVVVTADPQVAAAYALARADGQVGPGYALIDAAGVLRYRTFDPGLAAHTREIQILVDGLPS